MSTLQEIETALFHGNAIHHVVSMGRTGKVFTVLLQPFQRSQCGTRAEFADCRFTSHEPTLLEGDEMDYPCEIIGFDSQSLPGDRWRFCLCTDKVELIFESRWPDITRWVDVS